MPIVVLESTNSSGNAHDTPQSLFLPKTIDSEDIEPLESFVTDFLRLSVTKRIKLLKNAITVIWNAASQCWRLFQHGLKLNNQKFSQKVP